MPKYDRYLHPGNTWVEKTIGGAHYNYTRDTDELNVLIDTAEETHIYSRASYQYKYARDKSTTPATPRLVFRSASKSGRKEEWLYD